MYTVFGKEFSQCHNIPCMYSVLEKNIEFCKQCVLCTTSVSERNDMDSENYSIYYMYIPIRIIRFDTVVLSLPLSDTDVAVQSTNCSYMKMCLFKNQVMLDIIDGYIINVLLLQLICADH